MPETATLTGLIPSAFAIRVVQFLSAGALFQIAVVESPMKTTEADSPT